MSAQADYTYESQNDQRLDDLASKLRTLKNVTIDIHTDSERQNFELDETRDTFSSFGSSLAQSGRSAARAFGNAPGGVKQWRLITLVAGGIVALWFIWRFWSAWQGDPQTGGSGTQMPPI